MLFEWLFERKNPGAVGTFEVEAPESIVRSPLVTAIRGFIGLALIGGGVYLAFQARNPLVVLGGLAVYLGFAHYIHPRPNRENVGFAGGLIDHPLRWSDDQNRMLLFLQIVLFPGRFATGGVRDLARHVIAARSAPELPKGVIWERRDDGH
jgi:hypothetical protein